MRYGRTVRQCTPRRYWPASRSRREQAHVEVAVALDVVGPVEDILVASGVSDSEEDEEDEDRHAAWRDGRMPIQAMP